MKFNPCTGKCTDQGSHCEGCGRSHQEINEMNALVYGLIQFAEKREYENITDFAEGVAGAIKYKMTAEHSS